MKLAKIALASLLLICSSATIAQEPAKYLERKAYIGFEQNVYPAGIISGLTFEQKFNSKHAFTARVGVNIARRQDFSGLNDDERGWGPGLTLGYRHYLSGKLHGFYLGLRNDLWLMDIDWKDSTASGTTQITVLQPTFVIGYNILLNRRWKLGLGVSNGFEVNIRTEGEEVGQGFITLGQLTISRQISFN